MIPDSHTIEQEARKIEALMLRHLAEAGQCRIAEALELSETKVSRWKDGELWNVAKALAALGLKAVPADAEVVRREDLAALVHGTQEWALSLNVDGLVERAKK